jgi:hypothetical protein
LLNNDYIGKLNINIVSILGSEVVTYTIDKDTELFNFPVSLNDNGVYFVEIQTPYSKTIKKIVVK